MSATNKKCCLIFLQQNSKYVPVNENAKQITLKPEFPIYPNYL